MKTENYVINVSSASRHMSTHSGWDETKHISIINCEKVGARRDVFGNAY